MIVCVCNRVSEHDIHEAVRDGNHTFDDLQIATGVSTYCGCCRECAEDVLSEARGMHATGAELAYSAVS